MAGRIVALEEDYSDLEVERLRAEPHGGKGAARPQSEPYA
jgi:hypothetical protein